MSRDQFNYPIPGEPLWSPPRRPLRLPGVRRRPRRLTGTDVVVGALAVLFVWWVLAFVLEVPT